MFAPRLRLLCVQRLRLVNSNWIEEVRLILAPYEVPTGIQLHPVRLAANPHIIGKSIKNNSNTYSVNGCCSFPGNSTETGAVFQLIFILKYDFCCKSKFLENWETNYLSMQK